MLTELNIKDYTLIDNLKLDLSNGLNVFTGETGAGKSITIEALGLLLGDRASTEIIRKGAKKSVISCIFNLNKKSTAVNILAKRGLQSDNGTLIIRREIDSSGKSRCYCNDEPVTLGFLNELGNVLVDIHGQYDHQNLLQTQSQLDITDRYGNLWDLRTKVEEMHAELLSLIEEQNSLKLSQSEREQKIDLYKFQFDEINNVNLKPDEDEEIENLLPQIKNSEKLVSVINEAYDHISGEDNSVIDKLNIVDRNIDSMISTSKWGEKYSEQLKSILSQLKDIASDLEEEKERLQIDPKEVDKYIERNDLILKLKRKYGQTIKEILEHQDKTGKELEKLTHNEENLAEIDTKISKVKSEQNKLCTKLSNSRKKVAEKFENLIEKQIRELGMPKAKFKVNIEKIEPTRTGFDKIEFLFSPNIGEDLKPLKKIASGGEMSRTMLAIKVVLGKSDNIQTMIFDEIDSGVSGPMGQVIGRKLAELASSHQIFCITHLPQIASFSNRHYKIEKQTKTNRTYTKANLLENTETKIEEIARMLSGDKITKLTRDHAKELLSRSRGRS